MLTSREVQHRIMMSFDELKKAGSELVSQATTSIQRGVKIAEVCSTKDNDSMPGVTLTSDSCAFTGHVCARCHRPVCLTRSSCGCICTLRPRIISAGARYAMVRHATSRLYQASASH